MPPISSQKPSSFERPSRGRGRAARERLVEQARITQRRLGARRAGRAVSAGGERAAAY